jgi:hypothetical protein
LSSVVAAPEHVGTGAAPRCAAPSHGRGGPQQSGSEILYSSGQPSAARLGLSAAPRGKPRRICGDDWMLLQDVLWLRSDETEEVVAIVGSLERFVADVAPKLQDMPKSATTLGKLLNDKLKSHGKPVDTYGKKEWRPHRPSPAEARASLMPAAAAASAPAAASDATVHTTDGAASAPPAARAAHGDAMPVQRISCGYCTLQLRRCECERLGARCNLCCVRARGLRRCALSRVLL